MSTGSTRTAGNGETPANAARAREAAKQEKAKADAEEAQKRAETVTLRAGVQPEFTLSLTPHPHFVLDDPSSDVVRAIANPQKLKLDLPIKGTCERIGACRIKCSLSWLVTRSADGATLSVLVPGVTEAVVGGEGRFHIEVDGRPPLLDIIEAGLAGSGQLSAQITFAVSHFGQVTLPHPLAFWVDASVTVRWEVDKIPNTVNLGGGASEGGTKAALFGTSATIAVGTSDVLDKVDLAIEILDAQGSPIFRTSWKAGKRPASIPWSMGFAGLSHETFSNLKPENGLYLLGLRLVACRGGGNKDQVLLSRRNLLRVQQPLLTHFTLTFSPSWLSTYRASGTITGVAPGTKMKLAVAVVDSFSVAPGKLPVEVTTLSSDGSFTAALGVGHFAAPPESVNDRPVYAILSLPAAERTPGVRGPLAPYLNHNQEKFALWDAGSPTWLATAPWIASEEAPLAARGERPKAVVVNVLAPPADIGGDPYGPLTGEIAYADLRAWEGEYPYMYRDSKGLVTVGCGVLLHNAEAAAARPFVNKLTGAPATAEEKRAAFAQVMQPPQHKVARSYADRTNLVLTTEVMVTMAKELVDKRFIPELQKLYGKQLFDSFPLCVRRALVDMAYNAGTGKMDKWPMTALVKARNWQAAAAKVPEISRQERGAWRRSLLSFAASLPAQGGQS